MQIIKSFVTDSDCYKQNRTIEPQGLIIHSVGCPQPDPYVFRNTWNKSGQNACVHAVLGCDGTVIQCLPWDKRGWHVGGKGNNTHIGVEMTEPNTIKYTGGANWVELADGNNTASHVLGTYRTAVELFAYLCWLYKLNPLQDGVILSHHEAHLRGLGSNHGDVEHIWNKFGLTMVAFRQDIYNKMKEEGYLRETTINNTDTLTEIMGNAIATQEQCKSVMLKNKVSYKYINLIDTYYEEAQAEGVRADVLIAQSCLETGWFTFKGDVRPEQNNYAGLGTTGGGVKGCYFNLPEIGIRAQVQHLKAYASTECLNKECVDPRFSLVSRGCAPYVEWLGQKENPQGKGWAAGKDYGTKILNLLNSFINEKIETEEGVSPTESSSINIEPSVKYVARLDYNKPETQIGSYNTISNAILKVEEVTPYKIFSNETGEVIYESAFAKLGRPKAFTIEINKNTVARVEPFGKQATIINEGTYDVAITYSHFGLIIGIGWVDLAEVKINSTIIKKEEKTEIKDNKISFTDKEGTITEFTENEWNYLIKMWAYTGAAEEMISHHTVQELKTILTNI